MYIKVNRISNKTEEQFLCIYCTSRWSTYFSYTLICAGTALMNPISLPLLVTLTPQCHSLSHPGGCRALLDKKTGSITRWINMFLPNINQYPNILSLASKPPVDFLLVKSYRPTEVLSLWPPLEQSMVSETRMTSYNCTMLETTLTENWDKAFHCTGFMQNIWIFLTIAGILENNQI